MQSNNIQYNIMNNKGYKSLYTLTYNEYTKKCKKKDFIGH